MTISPRTGWPWTSGPGPSKAYAAALRQRRDRGLERPDGGVRIRRLRPRHLGRGNSARSTRRPSRSSAAAIRLPPSTKSGLEAENDPYLHRRRGFAGISRRARTCPAWPPSATSRAAALCSGGAQRCALPSVPFSLGRQQMRTPLIAGNWKLHKTRAEAVELVAALQTAVGPCEDREIVVAPVFTALVEVAAALAAGSDIAVAAQNCYPEASGAFTGEVSPQLLGMPAAATSSSAIRSAVSSSAKLTPSSTASCKPPSPPGCGSSSASARPWKSARPTIAGGPQPPGQGRPGTCFRRPDDGGGDCLRTGLGHRHRQGGQPRPGPGRPFLHSRPAAGRCSTRPRPWPRASSMAAASSRTMSTG